MSTVFLGTQADDLGVDVGWSVCEVNGQYMNANEIQEVITSGEPFSITFQTQPMEETEQVFFRTTISSKVIVIFEMVLRYLCDVREIRTVKSRDDNFLSV